MKSALPRDRVLLIALLISFCMGEGCQSTPPKEATPSNPAPQNTSKSDGPGPSGAPVIGYRVITSKRTNWAYAIVNHAPNNQELVDLAFALHKTFPITRFEILDDGSRVQALDRFLENTEAPPLS